MTDFKEAVWRGWAFVFPSVPRAALAPFVDSLVASYSEPHRAYHNLEHVADVIAQAFECTTPVRSLRTVVWALLWHDAVYDPRSKTNESDSVALAAHVADSLRARGIRDVPDAAETSRLIMLTCHNAPSPDPEVDPDGAVLIDADLSILGAPVERFARYDAGIRAEYTHVPDDAFATGRAAVLRTFLARGRIFATDEFHRRLEGQARESLRATLMRLEDLITKDADTKQKTLLAVP